MHISQPMALKTLNPPNKGDSAFFYGIFLFGIDNKAW